jgi:hypothetical protein
LPKRSLLSISPEEKERYDNARSVLAEAITSNYALKDGVVLAPGAENYIAVYTVVAFRKLSDTLMNSPLSRAKTRKLTRALFSSSAFSHVVESADEDAQERASGFRRDQSLIRREYQGDVRSDAVVLECPGRAHSFLGHGDFDDDILVPAGDLTRLSYLASVRKSVLAMLFGNSVASGKIRLDKTLARLGIELPSYPLDGVAPKQYTMILVD